MDNRKFKAPYKRQYVSSRQYHHWNTLGAIPLPTFPARLVAPYVLNIQTAENCTAYSGVDERYGVTGKQYDPEAQWQAELKILNVADPSQGVTIDGKMSVGLAKNFGFVPVGFTNPTDGARAYFWVTQQSGMDWFDSVRTAIFQLYQKYQKVIPVTIGVNWYSDWDNTPNGILTMNPTRLLGGHDIEIAGFETFTDTQDYLDMPGTWGSAYGDNGLFRCPRNVFNANFEGYGAAYWSDDPTLQVAKLNAFVAILQNFVTLLKNLISPAQQSGYPPPPVPVPHVSLIPALAAGIYEAEGNGKQAGMKYNNPGDIRGKIGNKYQASLGVTGYGENNLALFPDLATGEKAVVQLCTDVANNLLLGYPKPCSLVEFAKEYGDPLTQEEWDNYVAILCKHTGKVAQTTVTELL